MFFRAQKKSALPPSHFLPPNLRQQNSAAEATEGRGTNCYCMVQQTAGQSSKKLSKTKIQTWRSVSWALSTQKKNLFKNWTKKGAKYWHNHSLTGRSKDTSLSWSKGKQLLKHNHLSAVDERKSVSQASNRVSLDWLSYRQRIIPSDTKSWKKSISNTYLS